MKWHSYPTIPVTGRWSPTIVFIVITQVRWKARVYDVSLHLCFRSRILRCSGIWLEWVKYLTSPDGMIEASRTFYSAYIWTRGTLLPFLEWPPHLKILQFDLVLVSNLNILNMKDGIIQKFGTAAALVSHDLPICWRKLMLSSVQFVFYWHEDRCATVDYYSLRMFQTNN